MKKILSLFLAMILSCSMLTGCAPVKTKIAYTIYPIEYILNRLTDETIEYESILLFNELHLNLIIKKF